MKRRIGSLLLALTLCLTLLPAGAWAADNEYGFSINGTAVTEDNIGNLPGVTATEAGTDHSIGYDAETKTLTLENVTITGNSTYRYDIQTLACGDGVKTIKLVGKNVISSAAFENAPANISCIFAESSLTIEGKSTEIS